MDLAHEAIQSRPLQFIIKQLFAQFSAEEPPHLLTTHLGTLLRCKVSNVFPATRLKAKCGAGLGDTRPGTRLAIFQLPTACFFLS